MNPSKDPRLVRLQRAINAADSTTINHLPSDGATRDTDPRLHDYQVRAVKHLLTNPRAGLFMDMGLGKTATVLQALTPDHLPALVIAPKRVAEEVWPVEAPKWRPDLNISLVAGAPAKRAAALDAPADIYVIGRDNVADIVPGGYRTVIIDELSGYKNRSTKRWRITRKVAEAAGHVWGLTGTPAPNGLLDLWGQIYLLDSGQRLESTLTKYRERYFAPGRQIANGTIVEWNLNPSADQEIQGRIEDICLYMDAKDHLDLPPVIFNDVVVSMDAKTKRVYREMKDDLVAQVGGSDQEISVEGMAQATGKLSQIAAGFIYPDSSGEVEGVTDLNTAKLDAVQEIVDGTGSPVLVFYRFIHERDRLLAALPQARTIDEPGIVKEWNRGEVPVLLAHPESSGHGLNLQAGGHTIVWASLTWSPEQYQQANARLARQGQDQPVVIHRLVGAPVDETIIGRLEGKIISERELLEALK